MRVVVDANVFVSAVITKGSPHRILQRWLGHADFEIIACQQLLDEVHEVLTARPRVSQRVDQQLANRLISHLVTGIGLVPNPEDAQRWTRDADDDYLVALAREHGADFIVSRDNDLLEWEEQSPPVIPPSEFETILGPTPKR